MFNDNESVCYNVRKVEGKLNKKHNAVCFHAVRQAIAAGWLRVAHERSETNLADLFTKSLEYNKRERLLHMILP